MTAAAASSARPRALYVEHCMGTVFTLDVRDAGDWGDAIAEAVAWLHRVDAVFSTYRSDSDISRMRRGELRLAQADPDVAEVLDLCAQVQATTGGRFSALYEGRIDPTGLVKGWAIERAAGILARRGVRSGAVNGGGDVRLVGEAAPGRPWTVGITDPNDRTRLLTTVSGRDFAVAGSGTAERSAHIVDPFTGRASTGTAGVTVVGPSLTFADAYATAAFVMGRDAVAWIENVPEYDVLVVDADGRLATSSGWR